MAGADAYPGPVIVRANSCWLGKTLYATWLSQLAGEIASQAPKAAIGFESQQVAVTKSRAQLVRRCANAFLDPRIRPTPKQRLTQKSISTPTP